MSNTYVSPFTELVEKTQDLGRANAETKSRIRGIMNMVYTQEIPRVWDWSWLKSSSAISCLAEYKTGVASINTQDTTVVFGSGVVMDSSFTGRKIKFSDNPDVYDLTFMQSNTGAISPPLSGSTNIASGGYTIFKNIYSLPPDFDRFPINGGLLFYSGGQPTPLPELVDDDYYEQANASPTSTPNYCRPYGYDTAGNLQYEIIPPPSTAYVLRDEYIKLLKPMSETTAGTIVFLSGSTAVSGTGTLFTQATTGDYVRADGFGKSQDSTWYRILAITNNTSMTLMTAFRSDSSYTGTYTISSAPKMPYKMQDALIYGTLEKVLSDQKDPMLVFSHIQYAKILTDNKVIEQTRHSKDDVELIAEDPNYRR